MSKTKTTTQRDIYIDKMKLQLDELNLKMTELSAKAQDARDDARESYAKQMTRLRADAKAAGAKLDEMKRAGEDGWDKTVAEMDKLRDAFKHSFAYFKSQL